MNRSQLPSASIKTLPIDRVVKSHRRYGKIVHICGRPGGGFATMCGIADDAFLGEDHGSFIRGTDLEVNCEHCVAAIEHAAKFLIGATKG